MGVYTDTDFKYQPIYSGLSELSLLLISWSRLDDNCQNGMLTRYVSLTLSYGKQMDIYN